MIFLVGRAVGTPKLKDHVIGIAWDESFFGLTMKPF